MAAITSPTPAPIPQMIRPSLVRKSYLTAGEWLAITPVGHVKRFTDWNIAVAWAVNEWLLTVRTFGHFYPDDLYAGAFPMPQ